MIPAAWPREQASQEQLLVIRDGRFEDRRIADLPALLGPGDLLVVNDAATLPASLKAGIIRSGGAGAPGEIELRLVREERAAEWTAVVFGPGDWRTPTEKRPPPEPLLPGERLEIGELRATVVALSELSPRLVRIRFDELDWAALYRAGRPVQYSYLKSALPLWQVQNAYASRPWAVEQPSAGRPLRWRLLFELKARGVALARLTHAAGLSNTGDPAIDAALPLPEHYEIPEETVAAVANARRVIAVGTSVVRALEGSFRTHGRLAAGRGETDLRIDAAFRRRVTAGLLTGMHDRGASHFDLLRSFVPEPLLGEAYRHADDAGYLCHEFGDSNLIL